jgi:hypothetical protein
MVKVQRFQDRSLFAGMGTYIDICNTTTVALLLKTTDDQREIRWQYQNQSVGGLGTCTLPPQPHGAESLQALLSPL